MNGYLVRSLPGVLALFLVSAISTPAQKSPATTSAGSDTGVVLVELFTSERLLQLSSGRCAPAENKRYAHAIRSAHRWYQ